MEIGINIYHFQEQSNQWKQNKHINIVKWTSLQWVAKMPKIIFFISRSPYFWSYFICIVCSTASDYVIGIFKRFVLYSSSLNVVRLNVLLHYYSSGKPPIITQCNSAYSCKTDWTNINKSLSFVKLTRLRSVLYWSNVFYFIDV